MEDVAGESCDDGRQLRRHVRHEHLTAEATLVVPADADPDAKHEKRDASDPEPGTPTTPTSELATQPALANDDAPPIDTKRFIRRMRWQIFLGSLLGFLIALAIGAAFIAVWFTQASNLWAKSEELWEGQCLSFRELAPRSLSFCDPCRQS